LKILTNQDKRIYIITCKGGQLVANISNIINMDITNTNQIDFRSRPLIFLDLETTGLRVQKHEIIEIGALKVAPKKPFKVLGELQIKVKPKNIHLAEKEALGINGYSEKEWEEAMELEDALKMLDNFGKDGVLVGFNVNFDWAFLDKAYFAYGKTDPFYYHRLDVMPMVYFKMFSDRRMKRFSLGEACRLLKIERKSAHRALDDAKVTYLVFKKMFGYTGKV